MSAPDGVGRASVDKIERIERIGIVGCGHIGMVHASSLDQLRRIGRIDTRIHATYDVEPERAEKFARRYDATAFADLDSLLDVVDVVWVCTWTAGHRGVVVAAAERGIPIFCEKPLGVDLADCEAVAAALTQVPHQVGLVLRHAPVFQRIAELLHARTYGRTLTTVFRDDQFFPTQGYYGSTWRQEVAQAGGGTLIEHSIHDVDILRWILGDPELVSAFVNTAYGHVGIEDLGSVTQRFADGSTAQMISIWHQVRSRGSSRRLEVFCDDAYLWTESDYLGPLHVETSDGTEIWEADAPEWAARFDVPEIYQKALAQYAIPNQGFLERLAAGDPRGGSPSAADALAAHRIVDAAYRSAQAGGVGVRPN